jgi:hypothetical protein
MLAPTKSLWPALPSSFGQAANRRHQEPRQRLAELAMGIDFSEDIESLMRERSKAPVAPVCLFSKLGVPSLPLWVQR